MLCKNVKSHQRDFVRGKKLLHLKINEGINLLAFKIKRNVWFRDHDKSFGKKQFFCQSEIMTWKTA